MVFQAVHGSVKLVYTGMLLIEGSCLFPPLKAICW